MKTIILATSNDMREGLVADHVKNTWEAMAVTTKATFVLSERLETDIAKHADVVIMMPHVYLKRGRNPSLVEELSKLNPKIKFIMFIGDIEYFSPSHTTKEIFQKLHLMLFERADLILSDTWEFFRKFYASDWHWIEKKSVFWTKHVTKTERYSNLTRHPNPITKCLISGKVTPQYPYRHLLIDGAPNLVSFNPHPGYGSIMPPNSLTGANFAKHINLHYCAECAGKKPMNQVLEKTFIIPASYSLLLAEDSEDMRLCGFEPYKHYIPMTQQNAVATLQDVIKNKGQHEQIIEVGRKYVMENHTINNRITTMLEAMNKIGAI